MIRGEKINDSTKLFFGKINDINKPVMSYQVRKRTQTINIQDYRVTVFAQRNNMNNLMLLTLATQMEWTNSLKDTNYQNSLKK